MMGFEFEPARGGSAGVSDRVMTSQDYKKVEHVRIGHLSSSLQRSNSFDLKAFFGFV